MANQTIIEYDEHTNAGKGKTTKLQINQRNGTKKDKKHSYQLSSLSS